MHQIRKYLEVAVLAEGDQLFLSHTPTVTFSHLHVTLLTKNYPSSAGHIACQRGPQTRLKYLEVAVLAEGDQSHPKSSRGGLVLA